jgi:hypothetical protein
VAMASRGWIALSLTQWVPIAAQPPDSQGADAPSFCHRVRDNATPPLPASLS